MTQSEHVRFEHISIQLDADASVPKQSTKPKAFQTRFDTLHSRFIKREINAKELFVPILISSLDYMFMYPYM